MLPRVVSQGEDDGNVVDAWKSFSEAAPKVNRQNVHDIYINTYILCIYILRSRVPGGVRDSPRCYSR